VSDVHRWGELTRDEVRGLAPDALLVLPVGSTEQHGPHLATCTDALLAAEVAERAARAATRPEAILLAPTLAYGASDNHLPFGATLSLRTETFARVLRELLVSGARAGCRRAFVLNGHAGNSAVCESAVAEAAREQGIAAATALFSQLVDPAELDAPARGHAGWFETSLVLALRPELARLWLARPSPGGASRTRARGLVVAEPGRWQELDGFTDRPDEASPERGRRALDACVAAAARAFADLADVGV
jgi:creatinine amidohydrolase